MVLLAICRVWALAYYSEPLQRLDCTDVQDFTCLGQDEKRVMAIGREYRNVRMLSKMPFDENGFVSKQIRAETHQI